MDIETLFTITDTCNHLCYYQQMNRFNPVCVWGGERERANKISNHGETKEYLAVYRYSSNLK